MIFFIEGKQNYFFRKINFDPNKLWFKQLAKMSLHICNMGRCRGSVCK